jgi:hypothetical protein
LLFILLISQADDQGRLPGHPIDVKARCLPISVEEVSLADIGAWLGELDGQGCIRLYAVDAEPYVQITNWWIYQDWLRRAYPSQYPAPDGWPDQLRGMSIRSPNDQISRLPPRNAAKRGETPRTGAEPVPIPRPIPTPIPKSDSDAPTPSPLYEGGFPPFEQVVGRPTETKGGPSRRRTERRSNDKTRPQ